MKKENVIVFDNLVQPNTEIAGQDLPAKPVKAIWPVMGHFTQPNAKGELYRPSSLDELSLRAQADGEEFRSMFQAS